MSANVNSEKLKEYYDELKMVFSNSLDTLADKVSEQGSWGDDLPQIIHNLIHESEENFNNKYLELVEEHEEDKQIITIAKQEAQQDAKESLKLAVRKIFAGE